MVIKWSVITAFDELPTFRIHFLTRMIQRSQSLYLLLAVLLGVSLFFLPVFEFPGMKPSVVPPANEGPATDTLYYITSNSLLFLLHVAICAMVLITIFLFRNRNLQIRLCNLSLLLISGLIGLLFFTADSVGSTFNHQVVYHMGSYFPMIQLALVFAAARAIKKDEELVRSADRLR